ncbi:Holliday junction branch migration DNA helicase RuvB [Candidatus Gracilibacteria bacterium]|nr:Holliday junction branch migration DNA helicase RuvB [Candidatus Gracilibacteria bacterium]MCF7856690.1 Holliday junction branch migration DNA helicase RuvB [Candidatus Gracilibacteria bacterium]MCF7897010.1 Holliday junction branch migration DNA helicase RuvB [Candidatus Gracilibacteria bacterium]
MIERQKSSRKKVVSKQREISAKPTSDEFSQFDASLRPQNFENYIGQIGLKKNLKVFLAAAKKREEPLEHVLFYGPPGLGKTTLATVLANEMGVSLRITSGPALEKAGDLAAILTNLQPGDILFIDEIHRLKTVVEEVLYSAMEDFAIDLVLGKGPSAKMMRLKIPRFTLVGATTKFSGLSSPLRDRFGSVFRLNFYENSEIEKILDRSAQILEIKIQPEACQILARSTRATPRIANRLLRRMRDFAQINHDGEIHREVVEQGLRDLGVDSLGLDDHDRRILETLIRKFAGGPAGLSTLAAATSEEMSTIEEVIEPFLLQLGFISRTPRGRIATPAAWRHLRIDLPKNLKLGI